MNLSRCPHCRVKLGNYRYADACPHCHVELKHNTKPLVRARKPEAHLAQPWPFKIFFNLVRVVES